MRCCHFRASHWVLLRNEQLLEDQKRWLDYKTTMGLISSHGRYREMILYATLNDDFERVINAHINERDYQRVRAWLVLFVLCFSLRGGGAPCLFFFLFASGWRLKAPLTSLLSLSLSLFLSLSLSSLHRWVTGAGCAAQGAAEGGVILSLQPDSDAPQAIRHRQRVAESIQVPQTAKAHSCFGNAESFSLFSFSSLSLYLPFLIPSVRLSLSPSVSCLSASCSVSCLSSVCVLSPLLNFAVPRCDTTPPKTRRTIQTTRPSAT
jgi:hypothetical protein